MEQKIMINFADGSYTVVNSITELNNYDFQSFEYLG